MGLEIDISSSSSLRFKNATSAYDVVIDISNVSLDIINVSVDVRNHSIEIC